jgi:hypothetical protein
MAVKKNAPKLEGIIPHYPSWYAAVRMLIEMSDTLGDYDPYLPIPEKEAKRICRVGAKTVKALCKAGFVDPRIAKLL